MNFDEGLENRSEYLRTHFPIGTIVQYVGYPIIGPVTRYLNGAMVVLDAFTSSERRIPISHAYVVKRSYNVRATPIIKPKSMRSSRSFGGRRKTRKSRGSKERGNSF